MNSSFQHTFIVELFYIKQSMNKTVSGFCLHATWPLHSSEEKTGNIQKQANYVACQILMCTIGKKIEKKKNTKGMAW